MKSRTPTPHPPADADADAAPPAGEAPATGTPARKAAPPPVKRSNERKGPKPGGRHRW